MTAVTLDRPQTGLFPASEVRFIDVGDTRIAYRAIPGDGAAVFVLQPFWIGMDHTVADPRSFVARLTESHRVLIHDRRGTGSSERRPDGLTMEQMTADVVAVLTDAGVRRAILVGMGEAAALAVHVAAARHDRVERLILVDPALRPLTGQGATMLIHTLRRRARGGFEALARSQTSIEAEALALATRMEGVVAGPVAATLYESYLQAETLDHLPAVIAPTLFVCGVTDQLASEDEARTMVEQMAAAEARFIQAPAGSDQALAEAWEIIRSVLGEPSIPEEPDDAPPAAPRREREVTRPATDKLIDFVPAGPAPRELPRAATVITPPQPYGPSAYGAPMFASPATPVLPAARPIQISWGPPADIPERAIKLNRLAIDKLLIGEIEEALDLFRQVLEIAPHYDDAAVNHRELLSRVVQRRVAQWQVEQAEQAFRESERRAAQIEERARKSRRRGLLGWFLGDPA